MIYKGLLCCEISFELKKGMVQENEKE